MTKSDTRQNLVRAVAVMPLILGLLFLAPFAQGQNSNAGTAPSLSESVLAPQNAQVDAHALEARIGPGDLIEVRVFGVPELTQDVRVGANGAIALPLVGIIPAGGLTPPELELKIAGALRDGGFMKDPQVNVSAKELHSAVISMTGEVVKPGIYPVFGSSRLLDVITVAGGVTPRAGHVVTLTHRDHPGMPISVDIASDSAKNVQVYPGDSVVITKAGVVYVLGNVGHPAGLVMEDNNPITVLQALSLAGGTGKDAEMKGVRVIRKGPEGISEVSVPLKKILRAQAQDMMLLPGDVLYVPTNRSKEVLWRSAESLLQATTVLSLMSQ